MRLETPRRFLLVLSCLAAASLGLAQVAPGPAPGCSVAVPAASPRPSCRTLDSCVGALVAAAEPGPGISSRAQAASEAVLAFGEAAVPALLPLLQHESAAVRDLASYTLRDAAVRDEHLDALMASRLRGDGWIPPAIARIGSPRAIEFLVAELRKEPESETQLTWAFEMLGAKGVPYLVALFHCGPDCDERLFPVVASIFAKLGDRARGAIEPLLAVAEDSGRSRGARLGAIRSLGSIGAAAGDAVRRLGPLAARDPDTFEETVARAMIHVGGAMAVEGRRIEAQAQLRCRTEGSREAIRSRGAIESLGERIRSLDSTGDTKAVVADLRSLLDSRCFRLAAGEGPSLEFQHPESLRTWWESGGQAWLDSYVERPRLGRVDDLREHVVFPPGARKVLSLETAPGHPLATLLCPLADSGCGRETQGWAERARSAFSAAVVDGLASREDGYPLRGEALAARCEEEGHRGGASPSYATWRKCLAEHRRPAWALPLGRYREPSAGWLLVSGRRGHYEFCDELGAYDLATGAAYVAKSCSGLHLLKGGSVDFAATAAARKTTLEVGRIDVANLREAAWMMLLAPEAEEVFLAADYYPIPKGRVPALADEEDAEHGVVGGGMSWNSGQTQLSWSWLTAEGRVMGSGTLTWPSSYRPPESHAADLLRIAELGLLPGCPPAKLPDFAPATTPGGVSGRDARPQELAAVHGELVRALRERSARDDCAAVERP